MKILQVLPNLQSGGVEVGTVDLAIYMNNHTINNCVVSNGGDMVADLEKNNVPHKQMEVHSKNPWVIFKNIARIKQFITHNDIDLIHVRSRAPAHSCYYACLLAGIPMVSTFHGAYGHQNVFKKIYNSVMLKGDAVIAVSNYIAQHITKIYNYDQNKITTIPRGVDIEKYNYDNIKQDEVEQLYKEYNLNKDDIIITLPGRITRIKGHQYFIQAMQLLCHKLRDQPELLKRIKAIIIGDAKGRQDYIDELNNLIQNTDNNVNNTNLCDNIFILPPTNKLENVYYISDIVVANTTKPESFGRVAVEAQLMKCFVIAANHGGQSGNR